ncbi:hypothetical protein M426DRAFT_123168 [Hypoxylon sp. CI-4A]|nr:hypothetical protein M426DRAFT_123168 [Hypoxylon sp. CI-4A]
MAFSAQDEKPPRSKKTKSKVIRPLGYLERYEATMMSLDLYRSSMLTCRFAIPPRFLPAGETRDPELQEKLEQKVESAIAKIVLDHPLLRAGLRGEHKRKPVFLEVEQVDFHRHIEWRELEKAVDYEAEFLRLIRSRINTKVEQPEDASAWRMLVLRAEGQAFLDVMFEWGHAHLDGMSAKLFHEDLIRNLNSSDLATINEFNPKTRMLAIPPSRRRDTIPSLHALCRFPISPGWAVSTLWAELKPPALVRADLRATWAPVKLQPYTVRYEHFGVGDGALRNILRACREHRTTLTGLVQALAHVSFATRLTPAQARGFVSPTVVNLRPLMCRPEMQTPMYRTAGVDPKNTMANFMTMLDHEFGTEWVDQVRAAAAAAAAASQEQSEGEASKEKQRAALEPLIWSAAERTRAELQKRLDEGTGNDLMGLMKFVPDYRILFKDWVKKPRQHTVALTNLGVIDGDPVVKDGEVDILVEASERWHIERAVFSISHETHGAAMTICPVAVKGKELYISCDWQECAVDPALAEGVVADLEEWLKFFGRQA